MSSAGFVGFDLGVGRGQGDSTQLAMTPSGHWSAGWMMARLLDSVKGFDLTGGQGPRGKLMGWEW
jgi:hypothetical protein